MYQKHNFEIFPVSALEKVRGQIRPQLFEAENTALQGERVGFQIAYRSVGLTRSDLQYSLRGVEEKNAQVYLVREVPCTFAVAEGSDDYVLQSDPGTMPDLLAPATKSGIVARGNVWQAFYIVLSGLAAGEYEIQFSISDESGELLGQTEYRLHVSSQELPPNDLVCTFWMHYDSLADYYKLPLFSEEYNKILKSYIESTVKHGLTMLLTPLFTPPLDTEAGKERMTVQLVEVEKKGDTYEFGFDRLEWFMRFAEENGVRYYEMSHLFSQWGAGFAPKIVAKEQGTTRRIFGWETEALSDGYKGFLSAFLPRLRAWLIEKGFYERCYFHISDEPNEAAFEHYKACHDFVKQYLPDAKFVDAMSHYEYYAQGAVDHPFVAVDATETFIEKGVKDYFVYYCTGQRNEFVSNRFMSMPLERVRILGMQMYLNGVRGFLQWGYNFYYSFLSREALDPYAVTDCMGKFQSGDAFVVYPGKDGALESIRNEAFQQGIQDLRALNLLEKKIGREKVTAMLEESGMAKNFTDYPKNALWLIALRKKINRMIEQ